MSENFTLKVLPESRKLLTPFNLDSRVGNLSAKKCHLFQLILNFLYFLGAISTVVNFIKTKNIEHKFSTICYLVPYVSFCINQWLYNKKEYDFSCLIAEIEEIWNDHSKTIQSGKHIFLKTTKKSKAIHRAMLFPSLAQMATVLYAIMEYIIFYIRHQRVIEQNERLEFVFLSLPYVDLTKSPYYELTAIYGVLISTPLMIKICGINSLMLGLTCHLSGLYTSVASTVREIKSPAVFVNATADINLKKLKRCIEQHIRIFNVAKKLQDVIKYFLLTMYTTSSIIIGLTVFEVSRDIRNGSLKINSISVCFFMLLILSMFSWQSQKLIDASEHLADAYYDTAWYDESMEFKKNILFAMQCSQKQVGLSVLHYVLNRQVLGEILTKAWSYITVFNTFLKEN